MLDASGKIIYVGKARNLKNRVTSYFRKTSDPKTRALVKTLTDISVIITETENEAFLLESNLIKEHQPRFNVFLRDDKGYPYIRLTDHPDFPRLDYYRGSPKGKGKLFGPFPSAGSVRDTLKLMQKIFKIRSCSETFFSARTRPCLQYQINRCTAPCVGLIDKTTYQENIKHASMFLEGKNDSIVNELIKKMEVVAKDLEYEKAAMYRDQVASIRRVQKKQVILKKGGDVDVISGVFRSGVACVLVQYIRGGRMLGNKAYYPKAHPFLTEKELLSAFLSHYYLSPSSQHEIPSIVIVSHACEEKEWLQSVLSEKSNRKVNILNNVRGDRAKWLKMAEKNALNSLAFHLNEKQSMRHRFEALAQVLKLENIPERLECFDISHTMGEATVGSCVVFDQEGPVKADYRRYNIEGVTGGDDYAAMHQALTRRYSKLKLNEAKLPDLLIVDGGKGQLAQAENVLEDIQLSGVMLVGIAKGEGRKAEFDRLFISGKKSPITLRADSEALHLIQQIRDEAHRFALAGHQKRRAKARTTSTLQDIEGIGPKKRRELLRQFGGYQEIKRASVEELMRVQGINKKLAQKIVESLSG